MTYIGFSLAKSELQEEIMVAPGPSFELFSRAEDSSL